MATIRVFPKSMAPEFKFDSYPHGELVFQNVDTFSWKKPDDLILIKKGSKTISTLNGLFISRVEVEADA